MQTSELKQMLSNSTAEVLEAMFFTWLGEEIESPESWAALSVSARLSFLGNPSGKFGVRVQREAARNIAATFLALDEDEISEMQVGEVICELTNMVCGSLLSRLESDSHFELLHPEIEQPRPEGYSNSPTACCGFGLETGAIVIWLELGEPN